MSRGVALRAVVLAGILVATGCASTPTTPAASRVLPPPTVPPVGVDVSIDTPTGDVAPVAPAVFIGPPPAPAPAPPQLHAAPPPAPAPSGTGVWAVVIGIDDYPGGAHDLKSAGNDADDMDLALARYGVPPEQRLRLGGGAATATNLRRSLEWLTSHAGPDATAVFFYAGHVRKEHGHQVLVGADGKTVADTDVATLLRPLRAGRAWIVIAACYGGGFDEVLAPGRILTAAAPADRLAYESPQLGRSYLVEYLVRRAMLQGQADTSVEAAFAWAEAALRREHAGRVPVQFDQLSGNLSLGRPFASPRTASAPAARPSSPPSSTTTTTAPSSQEQRCVVSIGSTVRCGD